MSLTISANLSVARTPLVDLAIAVCEAYTQPNVALIVSRFKGVLTEDYNHQFLPGDLPEFKSREEFLKHLEVMLPEFGQMSVSSEQRTVGVGVINMLNQIFPSLN